MNLPIIKKKVKVAPNMANKGMGLEEMVNSTNAYYLINDIAVIHKKPIPIQIVRVDYPSRNKAVIKEAYYKTPSTTDYNGIYKGLYIDFDCKECMSLTSFPIRNVHAHQIEHLKMVKKHGGIAFLLIGFLKYDEYYIYPIENLIPYYETSLDGGRKSIPYEAIKSEGYLVKEGFNPRLDYLKGIDLYLQKNR